MKDFWGNRCRFWTNALLQGKTGVTRRRSVQQCWPPQRRLQIHISGLTPDFHMSTQLPSDPVAKTELSKTEPAREELDTGSAIWFWPGAIAISAGMAIAAAHAPARIRLLGVFSVVFGLILGWLLSRLAATVHLKMRTLQVVWVGIVTAGGLIGSVCHLVALQPTSTPNFPNPIATMLAARMQDENGIQPGDSMPEFKPVAYQPPTFGNRLQRFLISRIQSVGAWPSPWPELFWGGEVLAGTAAAVAMAWSMRSKEGTP